MKKIALSVLLGVATVAGYAQWSNPADEVPAYHSAAPTAAEKQPPLLTPAQIRAQGFHYAWQSAVYAEAAWVPRVLYQLPCYCRCDRALGHKSLRSCFEGAHGAECSTCAKEAHYAYLMTKQGKTPQQIRAGIMHKDFETLDLSTLGGM